MEFKDLCVKKSYTGKDGVEKVKWHNVGTLKIMDNGKMFVEMPLFPDIYVFDRKEKPQQEMPF